MLPRRQGLLRAASDGATGATEESPPGGEKDPLDLLQVPRAVLDGATGEEEEEESTPGREIDPLNVGVRQVLRAVLDGATGATGEESCPPGPEKDHPLNIVIHQILRTAAGRTGVITTGMTGTDMPVSLALPTPFQRIQLITKRVVP